MNTCLKPLIGLFCGEDVVLDGKNSLHVYGARENNLKDISLSIPHDELVVVSGVSGSGKSSLAFDTVYAEGQRRYIETFSPYTRQFFDKVKKPAVDSLERVRPAVAIQQRTRVTSSRSTVGSMTDIVDYLKVLWCNIASPVCPQCQAPLSRWSVSKLAEHLSSRYAQENRPKWYLAAPVRIEDPRFMPQELDRLSALGFSRLLTSQDFAVISLDALATSPLEHPALLHNSTDQGSEILVLLERIPEGGEISPDISHSIAQAFQLFHGTLVLISFPHGSARRESFRSEFVCDLHGCSVRSPKPAMFSPDHPMGACDHCRGFGMVLRIDRSLCVPDERKSIEQHAVQCWSGPGTRAEHRRLLRFCEAQGIPIDIPWSQLPMQTRELIFTNKTREFIGVEHWFKRKERKAYKMHVRVFLSRYRSQFVCPECQGSRLKPESLAYRVGACTISELWRMPIAHLLEWLDSNTPVQLPRELSDVVKALRLRLECLVALGLPYLSLDRQSRTLSGGETQRVNLVAALGSGLVSTQFVLDEPTVGLHPRDTKALIRYIRELAAQGNSVMMVEHDLDCISAADKILEMGPQAGSRGGQVTYLGSPSEWPGIALSLPTRHPFSPQRFIRVRNAHARNLKNLSLDIPLDAFVCISGVSGSGKSTLVHEVIKNAFERFIKGQATEAAIGSVDGLEQLRSLVIVDQSPVARSPRANVATFSGVWDDIRSLLADTQDARMRRLSRSAFSFNVDAGRCTHCKGAGFLKEDMQFLSDVYVPCPECLGKRFSNKVLEVRWNGRSVHDLMSLTIDDAAIVFQSHPRIRCVLENFSLLGLGYLTLGHPLSELSGGEAQRLKLVSYLADAGESGTLLIFDEPTTGLHPQDVCRLLELFSLLRSRGHSILCIEHNLIMLSQADWIIDLGPEGGDGGGRIVAEGTPGQLLQCASATAAHLAEFFSTTLQHRRFSIAPAKVPSPPKDNTACMLQLRGARHHNLKNIDLDLPLGQIVALSGLSGSGKSTIAKDIIYSEGQRRYLDCLSPYARQFIHELEKPDIDALQNVQPSVCVHQHTFQPSRLSTVGTMSEVYNFLRLLFAKVGVQHCPDHPDQEISALSAQEIAAELAACGDEQLRLLAPIVKNRKGSYRDVFERAVSLEIAEVRVDGRFAPPSKFDQGLVKSKQHNIEFVVGRFRPSTLPKEVLIEVVEQALGLGEGTLLIHCSQSERVVSAKRACAHCRRGFFKPDPEDLSFHSTRGRCPSCEGTGTAADGTACDECKGARISAMGRSLTLQSENIGQWCSRGALEVQALLDRLNLAARDAMVAAPILHELRSRLALLASFGLEYLPLHRDCSSLSAGELQRLRLATAIGTPLSGAMYIFDEPTAGLHPLDSRRIFKELQTLKERGNSVLIIEHDADMVAASDHIVEVGPGAGRQGGTITAQGPAAQILSDQSTLTAQWLSRPYGISAPAFTSPSAAKLRVRRASCNNIKDLSCSIPLHCMVVVAGVSGAGKSSLVHGIVLEGIAASTALSKSRTRKVPCIEGHEGIDRVLTVDQRPIGANSRSTPASFLGVWDEFRKVLAGTLEAKTHGWGPGFFSYNTGKGRCPECRGSGEIVLEMSFLPQARVRCESCAGTRYAEAASAVRYLGLSAADILALTFEEARDIFTNHRKIHQTLHRVCELGLGYLALGQSSSTLSGGESQRLKLASELIACGNGHTLYVLDEPTTGLHRADVHRLLRSLHELVGLGHTVLIIEHDPDVIMSAHHIIEMGPGSGEKGGRIIYEGPPCDLQLAETPWGGVMRQGEKLRKAG